MHNFDHAVPDPGDPYDFERLQRDPRTGSWTRVPAPVPGASGTAR
jgi:hypothetical protein